MIMAMISSKDGEFKCVKCSYQNKTFNAEITGVSHGAFTYMAKCPKCGSRMVNIVGQVPADKVRLSILEPERGVV